MMRSPSHLQRLPHRPRRPALDTQPSPWSALGLRGGVTLPLRGRAQVEALWSQLPPMSLGDNGTSKLPRLSELTGSEGLRFGCQLDNMKVAPIWGVRSTGLDTLLTMTSQPNRNLDFVLERTSVSQDGGLAEEGV